MTEQRYQAVLAVIKGGRTVTETAAAVGVSRQALHAWLAKYEAGGLEGLVDWSHRPAGMSASDAGGGGGGSAGGAAGHPSCSHGGSRSSSPSQVRSWW